MRHPARRLIGGLLAMALVAASATPRALATVTQPGRSLEDLRSQVDANPNDLKSRFLLGRAYSTKGRHADAVQQFQAILAVKPVPAVMFQLGVELAKLGDLQSAVFQWDEIVKKYRPNNLTTLGYLGLALHKLATSADDENRRFELHMSALDYFKRILRIDPGNVQARVYAGLEYAKLEKYEPAVKQWLLALRANPANIQVWVLVTKVLYKIQKFDKVQVAVNKILRLDPSNVFGRDMQQKLDKLSPKARVEDGPSVKVGTPDDYPKHGPDQPIPRPGVDDSHDPTGTVPPVVPPVAQPGPMPPDTSPTIGDRGNMEAEQLFLDGLDFKEKGNFEKALYSFLQAIDKDPKFSQVYLQIGEVYLSLAKLAPTKNQFEERVQLAIQALKKVGELTPGSLLEHAAHAKEVLVGRLQKDGFSAYHLTAAQKALTDDRPEDAYEEYVLLLSNAVFNPDIFFDLGKVLPKLTGGNMSDLQFFLEELYGQHKDNYLIEYLLGKTYLRLGKPQEASSNVNKFIDHAEVLAPHIVKYVESCAASRTDPPDLFISARLLIRRQDRKEAVTRLAAYLKVAKKEDIFYSEALKLKTSISEMLDAGMSKGYEDEKKEIANDIPRTKALFSDAFKPEHLDDKLLEDVKVFLANHTENTLARFMYAWQCRLAAPKQGMMQAELEKAAEDTFNDLLSQKANNPDWHVSLGLQALAWGLPDGARAHLKVAGDLLLLKGRVRSLRHANLVLERAAKLIDAGKLDEALILMDQGRVYDARSLNFFLVRYRYLMAKGRMAEAASSLFEMGSVAMGDTWMRLVIFTDLGLILFRAVLLALLLTSAMLAVRYFEDLHHLLAELWHQKGLLLPFSLAISVFLLLVFPTGLVVFLPALTWPMLRADEKRAFGILMAFLVAVPLILPLSVSDNFDLLRQAEKVRSGDTAGAREFFEKFQKVRPGDYNTQYLLGLVGMQEADPAGLDAARKVFKDLASRYAGEAGPINNLAVLEGLKGDTQAALDGFNKALGKNPANARALYNISAIYARSGQIENMEKYLRWARSVAKADDQLGRFEAASFNPPRLLLMPDTLDEERLAQYFTFSGTLGLLSLDAPVIFFLCWFLFGGGLVGFLIFTRERLDVLMRRCYHCLKIVCNGCQKVVDQKAFCADCFDEAGRKKVSPKERGEALRIAAFKKAAVFNLLMPGSGLAFLGQAVPGVLIGLAFLALALAVVSGGGWLVNYLYAPVESGPLEMLKMLAGLTALAVWAGLQALFFNMRGSVQP
ncbi:MAG: tetratricopeptide repeat protein [Candidatus Wallbacteria bacterium]|nr:tetratricopeptide repeat protein [Candidatus Wallbacteria bacterium]